MFSIELSLLLAIVWLVLLAFLVGQKTSYHKTLTTVFGGLALVIYFYWRIQFTILPFLDDPKSVAIWMWGYLFVEFLSISDIFQLYVFQILARDQPKAGILSERGVQASYPILAKAPKVDLLIPTYNEPYDILRKTLLRARAIKYSNLTVNLLDDGSRPEIEALANELGVRYMTRNSNHGAKAGNMNAALPRLDGDFVAILDADFLAFDDFLARAMPAFEDPKVGCVQFPQSFYNPDPSQVNSRLFRELKDEQWVWYHEVLPTRDQAGLATSCGSCSVVRRSALDKIGGCFPEDTITEDFDLSLRLMSKGMVTRYLHIPVAVGLHAQTVDDFFRQRVRWALGNVKAWRLAVKRDGLLESLRYFLLFEWRAISLPARIVTIFAPATVLLLDIWPLKVSSIWEYLGFVIPFIVVIGHSEFVAQRLRLSTFLTMQGRTAGLALVLGSAIIKQCISPKRIGFEVTLKTKTLGTGLNLAHRIILLAMMISVLSLIVGLVKVFGQGQYVEMYSVSLIWQAWNLVLVAGAYFVFTDRNYARVAERLVPYWSEDCSVRDSIGALLGHGSIRDISESGARIIVNFEPQDEPFLIEMSTFQICAKKVFSKPLGNGQWIMGCMFDSTHKLSDSLVTYLFSGRFHPEITVQRANN